MTNQWHKIHIEDASGKQHFVTTASPMSTQSEIRNLKRHLEQAKKYPQQYKFLDVATARVVVDDEPTINMSDDDLLELLNK